MSNSDDLLAVYLGWKLGNSLSGIFVFILVVSPVVLVVFPWFFPTAIIVTAFKTLDLHFAWNWVFGISVFAANLFLILLVFSLLPPICLGFIGLAEGLYYSWNSGFLLMKSNWSFEVVNSWVIVGLCTVGFIIHFLLSVSFRAKTSQQK